MNIAVKRAVNILVAGLLAVPLITAHADSTGNCLNISGTATFTSRDITDGKQDPNVDLQEKVTLTYKLTPGGSYTQVVNRDPVNLVLVLDRSNSMGYTDGTKSNPTPTRMEILKSSATTLVNNIANLDLNKPAGQDKIGLVPFGSFVDPKLVVNLTTVYSTVRTNISGLTLGGNDGGTNIEQGLRMAKTTLTANGKIVKNPYVVLVTDGFATHYYNDSSKKAVNDDAKARQLALNAADQLALAQIPVYTIALGKKSSSDIDHALLVEIANKTGGQKFDATDTSDLNQVFTTIQQEIAKPGLLSTISIRQPLPPGFVLANNSNPNARIENIDGINYLIIGVPDISYPYKTPLEKVISVDLKQTSSSGTYAFEDGQIRYTNACGSADSGTITFQNKVVVLNTLTLTDMYGNVYVADRDNVVTRYKLGDYSVPQWAYTKAGFEVAAMSLTNDKHSILKVDYRKWNSKTKTYDNSMQLIDMTPTAPTVTAATGITNITEKSWKTGTISLSATGSSNQLPKEKDGFVYKNSDFSTNFINNYQYRINQNDNGTVTPIQDWDTQNKFTGSGKFTIDAQATTAAVSGSKEKLIVGPPVTKEYWLDNEPPLMPDVNAEFTTIFQEYKFTISNIKDNHSGIAKNGAQLKMKQNSNDTNPTTVISDITAKNVFIAKEQDLGLYLIQVTDNVNLTTIKTDIKPPVDDTPPEIDINSSSSDTDNTDQTLNVTVREPESYVYSTTITIDGKKVTNLPTKSPAKVIKYTFKLSEVTIEDSNPQRYKDAANRIGWHQVIVESQSGYPLKKKEEHYFLINPGPTGKLTTSKDYSSTYSSTPVVVTAEFNKEIVPRTTFKMLDGTTFVGKEVKVISMQYAVMGDGNPPKDSDFQTLGQYQFRINKEGDDHVYLRLIDSTEPLGNVFTTSDALRVKIKYNQNYY